MGFTVPDRTLIKLARGTNQNYGKEWKGEKKICETSSKEASPRDRLCHTAGKEILKNNEEPHLGRFAKTFGFSEFDRNER